MSPTAHDWLNLGRQQFQAEQYSQALQYFNQALNLDPTLTDAWNGRGAALKKLGNFSEALAAYDCALQLDPNSYKAWCNKGLLLEDLKDYSNAVTCYETALNLQPNAPNAADIRTRFSALKRQGYQQPGNPSTTDSNTREENSNPDATSAAEAWFNQGNQRFMAGDFWGAIAAYEQALAIKPDDHQAFYNKEIALADLGRYEQAIAAYEQALAIKPDDHQAFSNKGIALADLGRYEQAIAAYEQALAIKPDLHEAFSNKGIALADLGRYEQAIASYEQAIASYEQALAIKPDDHQAFYNKEIALAALGRYEQAIASYEQALAIKPDFWQAWINRGSASGNSTHCKTTVFLSLPLAMQASSLDKRGYEGQLASYEEGLKYVQQESQPEGWGRLHRAIGQAHYFRGRFDFNSRYYLQEAVKSYQTAFTALTATDLPKAHLEVVSDLIRAYLGLGNAEAARDLRLHGLEIFRDLLNAAPSLVQKRQLEMKFSNFSQVAVDSLVQEGEITAALETAERYKNRALTWILEKWKEQVWSPDHEQMQSLLDNSTAVVYWHLSPDALTTFVLKPHAAAPTLSAQPADAEALERRRLPESWQRLREFETWVKDWNQQYADYGGKGGGQGKENGKSAQSDQHNDPKTYPWRVGLKQNLERLREILGIEAIEAEILKSAADASEQAEITQLILIPHRDLHRFPLHALFSERFTVTYLPSLQVGLSLQQRRYRESGDSAQQFSLVWSSDLSLLSVEDPSSDGLDSLAFAETESAVVSQLFRHPTRISAESATQAAVEKALSSNHQVFHFTGHGAYDVWQPQNSMLALAGKERLIAKDVSQHDLTSYKLVCLAACETAMTGDRTIESEYVGLVSAFLQAGAETAISTLWTVEEISNAWIMIRFYQFLLAGNSPSVALKRSQQWLRGITYADLQQWLIDSSTPLAKIESETNAYEFLITEAEKIQRDHSRMNSRELPFQDPYFWAAFTVTGRIFHEAEVY
jgi:tetratricopeptide (TPR) repeat protein